MKENKALCGSISILIGAVIAVLALLRGIWQTGLLIAVFSIWGLWVIVILLLPLLRQTKRRNQRRMQLKKLHDEGIAKTEPLPVPELSREPAELLLLRHVNYRISAYLRAAYPDMHWEWCEKNPERLALHGGVGRIRVFGVSDFDHADVTLDRQANIRCDMIKMVPLSNVGGKVDPAGTTPPNKTPIDPQIWYESQGRKVLETLVADLNSRGHSQLTLREDGDVCVKEDKDEITKEHLSGFPEKLYWPRLVQVFESNGLAAEITAQGILVSW